LVNIGGLIRPMLPSRLATPVLVSLIPPQRRDVPAGAAD